LGVKKSGSNEYHSSLGLKINKYLAYNKILASIFGKIAACRSPYSVSTPDFINPPPTLKNPKRT